MKDVTHFSRFLLREKVGRIFLVLIVILFLLYFFRSSPQQEIRSCMLPDGKLSFQEKRYAVVIDAGSTGSRVHVYHFDFCGDRHPIAITHELFVQTKPGLSSYQDPEAAANSLIPLLESSLTSVPPSSRSCAPITVRATAGLRLLEPKGLTDRILEAVTKKIGAYPFPLAGGGDKAYPPVAVIDGSEEGVFAWVALNFLLKTIGHSTPASHHRIGSTITIPTFASLDLGGGSTQIVFVHPKLDRVEHKDYLYEFAFGGSNYNLYQHSYLGFGLMEARKKIKSSTDKSSKFACFPIGFTQDELIGGWNGYESCASLARSVFNFDAICATKPCGFSGVYHPDIHPDQKIYAFSYFQEIMAAIGFESSFTLSAVRQRIDQVCRVGYNSDKNNNPDDKFAQAIRENPHICLDAVYITVLIGEGYRIADDREVYTTKKIDGYETSWTLGAAIDMLGRNKIKCH